MFETKEFECAQVHGNWGDASAGPEGSGTGTAKVYFLQHSLN